MNSREYLTFSENYLDERPVLSKLQFDYFKSFNDSLLREYETDFLNYNTGVAFADIVFNYSKHFLESLHDEFTFAVNNPRTFESQQFADYNKSIQKVMRVCNECDRESVVSELRTSFTREFSELEESLESFSESGDLFKVFSTEELFESSKNVLVSVLFRDFLNLCRFPDEDEEASMKFLNDYLSSRVDYFMKNLATVIKDDYKRFIREYESESKESTMFI